MRQFFRKAMLVAALGGIFVSAAMARTASGSAC